MSRSINLLSKFRGSMVGGLMGDCLGSPFEGDSAVSTVEVNHYFTQLFDPKIKIPYKPFTDDTVMTKAVAENLIQFRSIEPQELAKRFTIDYFTEPKRGYSSAIHDVFLGLRNAGFEDPFYPAKKQFGGRGSFGNGAAMRVAPLALFSSATTAQTSPESPGLMDLVNQSSMITHAHKHGIRGAILQSLAIKQAFLADPKQGLNTQQFLDSLISHMHELEKDDKPEDFLRKEDADEEKQRTFVNKLNIVRKYLNNRDQGLPSVEDIRLELGIEAPALESVPTAIYCFLAGLKPISTIECENHFLRPIQYAISLGGDTDTIASMAGSLSGAYFGIDEVPKGLYRHCENVDSLLNLADKLHEAAVSRK